jgi:DNA-binding response OmpR family regulator
MLGPVDDWAPFFWAALSPYYLGMARILVIDDDRVQRLVASQALSRGEHQVLEATDGAEGLEIARTHHPDLIVCDVVMPGMNGLQFVTALRQEEDIAGIPVIMLTSMAERAHMRLGMNAGADDYLAKPFSFDELREAVDAQLSKRRTLQEGLINSMNNSFVTALEEQRESLAAEYEKKLVQAISSRWDEENNADAELRYDHAVLLKVQLGGAVTQVAKGKDANALLRKVYDAARDGLHLFNAVHLIPAGSDVVAIYVDEADSIRVRANVRAVRASLGLQKSLATLGITANIAIHCGPVTVLRMGDPLHGGPASMVATGTTVEELDAICDAAHDSQIPIVASASLVGEMGGKVVTGRNAQATRSGDALDVIEVTSLR